MIGNSCHLEASSNPTEQETEIKFEWIKELLLVLKFVIIMYCVPKIPQYEWNWKLLETWMAFIYKYSYSECLEMKLTRRQTLIQYDNGAIHLSINYYWSLCSKIDWGKSIDPIFLLKTYCEETKLWNKQVKVMNNNIAFKGSSRFEF